MRSATWALLFVGYGSAALGASWLVGNAPLPKAVENVLTAFSAPLFVLAWPFFPLLRRLNLMTTAYWSYPKTAGLIVVIAFWTLLIYGASVLLRKATRSE